LKRILVTGCGGPASNNFIKSLRMSEEKIYIVGTDCNNKHIELSNADTKYLVPPVRDSSYINKINSIIEKEDIQFIHIQPDVEVAFISENREKINANVFLPNDLTIKTCQNKMELNKKLDTKKVPVPKSFFIDSLDSLKSGLKDLLNTYEKAWLRAIRGAGSRGSIPIKEPEHGEMWIDYWTKMKGLTWNDFMISEFLPGKEYAFQSLWKNGEIITSQARERLEYVFGNLTVSGQSSSPSVAKTVHDNRVNEIASKAILAVDDRATGIFCVDLKENVKGTPCVTEINAGRFFTTSNFFTEAGSNMPYYYIKMGFNEELPEFPKYNAVKKDLYWIRLIDCGHKMIGREDWTYKEI
jgi:carbamoyl-phosphate synthase large subunit